MDAWGAGREDNLWGQNAAGDNWSKRDEEAGGRGDEDSRNTDLEWKGDQSASGWKDEEGSWNTLLDANKLGVDGSDSAEKNGFLLRRLGLDFKSIFQGKKTLTKR